MHSFGRYKDNYVIRNAPESFENFEKRAPGVLETQWLGHPSGVRDVLGSILMLELWNLFSSFLHPLPSNCCLLNETTCRGKQISIRFFPKHGVKNSKQMWQFSRKPELFYIKSARFYALSKRKDQFKSGFYLKLDSLKFLQIYPLHENGRCDSDWFSLRKKKEKKVFTARNRN